MKTSDNEQQNKIKLFESQQVRSEWDEAAEKWWFSVLDIVAILTDQADYKKVRNYWKWLKNQLIAEGSQLVSATHQLKLQAARLLRDVPEKSEGFPVRHSTRKRQTAIFCSVLGLAI